MTPTPPPDLKDWIDNFMYVCFAAFAGFMGYVFREMEDRKKVSLVRGCVIGVSSGIVGLLASLLCGYLGIQERELIGFCAGMLGWLGPEVSIHLLGDVVRKKLGMPKEGQDGRD